MNDVEALITVDLGTQNGGTRRFKDLEELRIWIKQEFDAWTWTNQNFGYGGSQYWGTLSGFNNTATSLISAAASNDPNVRAANIDALAKSVVDHYKNNRLFASESPIGHFLLDIYRQYPQQGIAALEYLSRNVILNIAHPEAMAGFIRGVLFKSGISTQDAEKAALNDLYSQFSKVSTQASSELDSLIARKAALEREITQMFEGVVKKTDDELGKFNTNSTSLLEASKKVHDEIATNATKEFAATNQTFKEQMRMRASVEYWGKQAIAYLWIAIGTGITFVIACGVAAYNAEDLLNWLLKPSQPPVIASFEGIPLWKYGITLIFLGLSIWILRTLLRACLSYLHLYTDAGQRVVMVQTFLALIQDKADIQPQDREIILRSLFRPAKIGLLGKDGEMITVLDAFAKRFGQDK